MTMPAPTFHSGPFGKLKLVSNAGSTFTPAIDLPCSKWDFTSKGNNRGVSNSRDGRKRIPGLADADGSFNMPLDSANDPTVTANGGLARSAVLVANFYVDASHFWAGTIIIDEIGAAMEIEGEIVMPVKWSLESGDMTPPTYS